MFTVTKPVTKRCARCQETKPVEAFAEHRRYRDGRQSYCRECMKAYRVDNRERINARLRERRLDGEGPFAARLLSTYGITPAQYRDLLAAQGGGCAICGASAGGYRGGQPMRLHVDHDHRCCPGKKSCGSCVRGLLCSRCNFGLGQFGDDVSTLKTVINYLENYS